MIPNFPGSSRSGCNYVFGRRHKSCFFRLLLWRVIVDSIFFNLLDDLSLFLTNFSSCLQVGVILDLGTHAIMIMSFPCAFFLLFWASHNIGIHSSFCSCSSWGATFTQYNDGVLASRPFPSIAKGSRRT
ncbi:hypothetical protein BJ166DRAFT_257767 [Pestalotiopsis sp. NC0098]|nr:hypothetical protein BJ166DRAFT_257767 [Pestalotiopsis sp. NC0098]